MERSRSRVLVVEDRPSVLRVLVSILETAYEVIPVGSGAAALEAMAAGGVDVILTDVRMPGLDGFAVLRAAQQLPDPPAVVLMTAYASVPDAVAAIKLGASDYVAKPADADELGLAVARAMEGRHGRGDGPLAAALEAASGAVGPGSSQAFRTAVEAARDAASRRYLLELMRRYRGNVTHAAAQAGMTRESLHRVLRRYDLHSEDYKASPSEGPPAEEGGKEGAG